jgi:RecA-family ATPase
VKKFAEMIGKPLSEAQRIYAQYDRLLPFVSRLAAACQREANQLGYTLLYDGARRHWDRWAPRIYSKGAGPCSLEEAKQRIRDPQHPWFNGWLRRADIHTALNALIQGSAARHTKLWMRACWREGIVPLLQMHDGLECSITAPEQGELVARLACEAVKLEVLMRADLKFGRSWGDAKHTWQELHDHRTAEITTRTQSFQPQVGFSGVTKVPAEIGERVMGLPIGSHSEHNLINAGNGANGGDHPNHVDHGDHDDIDHGDRDDIPKPAHICAHCHLDPPDGDEHPSAYNDAWLHPRCEDAFMRARMAEWGIPWEAPTTVLHAAVILEDSIPASLSPGEQPASAELEHTTQSNEPTNRSGSGSIPTAGETRGNGYGKAKKQTGAKLESVHIFQDAGRRDYQRELKWRNPDGTKACSQQYFVNGQWINKKPDGWIELPYRLPELLAAPSNVPVEITEGPKDAETLRALGYIATTNAGGAGKFTEVHARWFTGKQTVHTYKDNDDDGDKHVHEVARVLTGIVPDVRVISFSDVPAGEDVTWWLEHGHTKQELDARITAAKSAALPFPFINMSNWDHEPIPEQQWVVFGRIPRRQSVIFSGEGGAGKSIIQLHLSAATVLGCDWLGATPEQGPALFVDCEDDQDVMHYRLAAITQHYGVCFTDLINSGLHLTSLVGQDTVLATVSRSGLVEPTMLYRRLLQAAGDIKPTMIGIAAAATVFAGEENNRSQVQQFINLTTRLAIVANGAVALITHPSITGINTGTGLSGSTQWHNAVRARFFLKSLKAEPGEQPDNDLREIEFKKNQYGAMAENIPLRWQDGMFLPIDGATFDRAEQEARADDVFLELLRRFHHRKPIHK